MSRKVSQENRIANRKPVREVSQALNEDLGFRIWCGPVGAMPHAHTHSEIEINYLLRGSLRYFLAGRFQYIEARQLSLFWAGAPHQVLEVAPATQAFWITLPLSWFLQWQFNERFTEYLLGGGLVTQASSKPQAPHDIEYSNGDETLLQRWRRDCNGSDRVYSGFKSNESQRIVLLELEARLRRLARDTSYETVASEAEHNAKRTSLSHAQNNATARQVEKLAAYLSRHYRDDVSVEKAARDVGLHPKYAMQIFKHGCGITLGNYLQKLRLSHAQRLLLTTNWPVSRVAEESGFDSLSRFHAVFRTQTGQTPRAYRLRHDVE